MNPRIDLSKLSRGRQAAGTAGAERTLVAPRSRVLTRYVLPLGLIGGFVAVGVYSARDSLAPAIPVSVIVPTPISGGEAASADGSSQQTAGSGGDTFDAPGWIEPDPYPVIVAAQTAGVVRQLHVLEGQAVTSGALVAELVDDDARLKVAEADSTLALKQAELASARRLWDHPITLREAVQTSRATLAKLRAERVRAGHAATIARRLSEITSSLTNLGAEGRFAAEKTNLELLVATASVDEIDAQTAMTSAGLAAAEERLELRIEDRNRLDVAEAEAAKARAALDQARYELARRRVFAPTSGVVMKLFAAEGSGLMPEAREGMKVAEMYNPSKIQVRADVPLVKAALARPGLTAEVECEGMAGREFHGVVTRVVHEADIQKNTLPVKVAILDPDPALKPEMIVRLKFTVPTQAGAPDDKATTRTGALAGGTAIRLLVPAAVVTGDGESASVWLMDVDRRAHRRRVQMGPKRGEMREAKAGLQIPDKIIASNLDKLTEGARVNPVEDSK